MTRLTRFTGEFRWTAMAGVPIFLLGTGLLIPYRQPGTDVGTLTMTQILVGLGSCIFTVCGQIPIMASVSHQEFAVVMAIWGHFGSIGAAVGSAIAGGMWNNMLEKEVYNRLPEDSKSQAASIYLDIHFFYDPYFHMLHTSVRPSYVAVKVPEAVLPSRVLVL